MNATETKRAADEELMDAVMAADEAFWTVITKAFPGMETDFPDGEDEALREAMLNAAVAYVRQWKDGAK